MDDDSQVGQLEKALLDQAASLARERLQNAEAARARILKESAANLVEAEQRERQAVRAEADRLVQRRVQAAEGHLTAELDRLRWALAEAALSELRLALADLAKDEDRYADILERFVADAVKHLPPGDLVAEVNAADLNRLSPRWEDLAQRGAPGRRIELASHGRESLGGINVRLADDSVRLDQTFEARMERLKGALAEVVMARMFPGTSELNGLAHG